MSKMAKNQKSQNSYDPPSDHCAVIGFLRVKISFLRVKVSFLSEKKFSGAENQFSVHFFFSFLHRYQEKINLSAKPAAPSTPTNFTNTLSATSQILRTNLRPTLQVNSAQNCFFGFC